MDIIVEDRVAIQELMARYSDAVNRSDGDAWISTWAEKGARWSLMGQSADGREAILGLWQGIMEGFEFALFMPGSNLCSISGDKASGHWYQQEHLRDKEGLGQIAFSRYADTYVKVGGQWYFETRDCGFIYYGSSDLSGSYTPIT